MAIDQPSPRREPSGCPAALQHGDAVRWLITSGHVVTPETLFLCYVIRVARPLRWYRTARRHRIGKGHAMHVINSTEPVQVPASETADARLVWIGEDDRGIELSRSWRSTSQRP